MQMCLRDFLVKSISTLTRVTARLPSDRAVESFIDLLKKQILLTPRHFSPYSKRHLRKSMCVYVCVERRPVAPSLTHPDQVLFVWI